MGENLRSMGENIFLYFPRKILDWLSQSTGGCPIGLLFVVKVLELHTVHMSVLMVFLRSSHSTCLLICLRPGGSGGLFVVAPPQAAAEYSISSSFFWNGPLLETIDSSTECLRIVDST